MKFFAPIISIFIALSAGFIGSFFTKNSVSTWYTTINKPSFNPPSWVFAPVWTVLYVLMGIAGYLIWNQSDLPAAKIALSLYVVQLVLNTLWSILFFGIKNPGVAFFEIIILLILIIGTTVLFWRINPWAGALMIPYIMWVSFASYLNYTIWQLN